MSKPSKEERFDAHLRELFANEEVPDWVKDDIVKAGMRRIQHTWSATERLGRQVERARAVGITRIDLHHMNGQIEYRSVVLVPEQRKTKGK